MLEKILDEVEKIAHKDVDTYSLADRQRVGQLRIEFAKARASNRAEKKAITREKKKYFAEQVVILKNTVWEDWKKLYTEKEYLAMIENDEWYVALEVKNDANEYLDDICDIIKETFGELITLIRDAEKIITEQTH